jgi:hypothetical protein
MPADAGLTPSPARVDAPTLRIFIVVGTLVLENVYKLAVSEIRPV